MPTDNRPHVVIIGGGFGGLHAAHLLRDEAVRVTIVDRRNHHVFQPLLYQVASAALNPTDIAMPIRNLVREKNAEVLLGEVTWIDVDQRKVFLRDGTLEYDFLIVAAGATHSYFGRDDWEKHAPGLKTVDDALKIRRRVLLSYEAAEREPDEARRRELLTFVIVGGGATGVEMAGALAEIAHHSLARDFKNIDPRTARVILIEGLDKVLPHFPDALCREAQVALESVGVEVLTGRRVKEVSAAGVQLDTGEWLRAHTVIWAAGVAASPLAKSLKTPLDRVGRVKVTKYLTVPGRDEVFVVGDLAYVEHEGEPIPQVAPAAMQMGTMAGRNVRRRIHGRPMKAFSYWDRGMFAVIGRGKAVGRAFQAVQMTGAIAWAAWLFIHLLFLVGFRNKLVVFLNWVYSFLSLRRAARLITGDAPDLRLTPPPSVEVKADAPAASAADPANA